MKNLKGLATGVGSLPHKEIGAALDLIFAYLPSIPFWPQLPKRDIREGMVAQFSENLPCLKVARDGLFFDGSYLMFCINNLAIITKGNISRVQRYKNK